MRHTVTTDKNMNAFEEIELTKFMENCLHESIEKDYLDFYKSCSFDDYKDSLISDLYDENGNELGEGIDYISGRVVIDDDNIKEIKELFEIARDRAYKECSEEE